MGRELGEGRRPGLRRRSRPLGPVVQGVGGAGGRARPLSHRMQSRLGHRWGGRFLLAERPRIPENQLHDARGRSCCPLRRVQSTLAGELRLEALLKARPQQVAQRRESRAKQVVRIKRPVECGREQLALKSLA